MYIINIIWYSTFTLYNIYEYNIHDENFGSRIHEFNETSFDQYQNVIAFIKTKVRSNIC